MSGFQKNMCNKMWKDDPWSSSVGPATLRDLVLVLFFSQTVLPTEVNNTANLQKLSSELQKVI